MVPFFDPRQVVADEGHQEKPQGQGQFEYLTEQVNLVGREKQFPLLKQAHAADQDAAAGQSQKRLKIGFGLRLFRRLPRKKARAINK